MSKKNTSKYEIPFVLKIKEKLVGFSGVSDWHESTKNSGAIIIDFIDGHRSSYRDWDFIGLGTLDEEHNFVPSE